jgi:hypothetical protein
MPRRSKALLKKKTRSNKGFRIRSLQIKMYGHSKSSPDGTILVSSAAVDAFKLHCGGFSAQQMLESIHSHIRAAFNYAKTHKPVNYDSDHVLWCDIKFPKMRQYVSLYLRIEETKNPKRNRTNLYIEVREAHIRFDINKLENIIAEKHLLRKSR